MQIITSMTAVMQLIGRSEVSLLCSVICKSAYLQFFWFSPDALHLLIMLFSVIRGGGVLNNGTEVTMNVVVYIIYHFFSFSFRIQGKTL